MIGLPEDLYLQCEDIVKSGKHGYASVSELVKESVRRRLEELREYFEIKEKDGWKFEGITQSRNVMDSDLRRRIQRRT